MGKIRVSPNPSRSQVRVLADELFESATLISTDGKTEKVWSFAPSHEAVLDLSGYPSGQYWILLSGKKGSAVCPVAKQ